MKQSKPLAGFLFAMLATATWGMLPIAVQFVLSNMNAVTLVWYRFLVAAAGLFLILGIKGGLPKVRAFSGKVMVLCVLGIFGLAVNFLLFSQALHYISPTTNQVLWQLAPFTMILCGVLLFREHFGRHQKIGAVLLLVGLLAFFNDKFGEILQFGHYALGVMCAALAAIVWVCYGVAQKILLKTFSSQQILWVIYVGCAVVLSPFAEPAQFGQLSGFEWWCFVFCCLNTLVAYGAYAEALNHWEASKVSVVTILLPIFTMVFSIVLYWILPEIFVLPQMNTLSYVGSLIVVAGTIWSAVGGQQWWKRPSAAKQE